MSKPQNEKEPKKPTILDGLEDCPLHKRTPFGVSGVSYSQLSIARHYGGINYNGESYTYNPITDELIRNDVLAWKTQQEKNLKASSIGNESQIVLDV